MKNYIAEILKGNRSCWDKEISAKVLSFLKLSQNFFHQFKFSLFDNRYLIYICLTYYMSTFIVGLWLNVKITGDLNFYYMLFYGYLFAFFFLIWSLFTIIHLIKNFKQGFNGIPVVWSLLRQRFLCSETISRFIIIFSIIPLFICSYSSFKQAIPLVHGFSSDALLFHFDKILHFNVSPWEILHPIIGYPAITRFIDFCYVAWGSIFAYSLLYMACHCDRRLRLGFFISLACCWIVIGNILAMIFSSAGPCYFSQATGSAINPYMPLFDYLRSIPDLQAINIQDLLWKAFQTGHFMPLGGISAMPSMHVSVAVLLALLYRKINKWLGWTMIGFAIIIQVGSVHLGWHYAADGYISATLTILIWKITERNLAQKPIVEGSVQVEETIRIGF